MNETNNTKVGNDNAQVDTTIITGKNLDIYGNIIDMSQMIL